jgi:hypothetical protein
MPLQLEDMTFGDGAAYAHTYITSFQSNAYSRASFADQTFDQRIAGVVRRWPKNYGQTLVTYKKVVDTETGELVGWVKIAFENTNIDPKLYAPTGEHYSFSYKYLFTNDNRHTRGRCC